MNRIKLFSNFIIILLISSNVLLALLFIYVKKENTRIESTVYNYYSTSYKNFNRTLDEIYIWQSDIQQFKEIKYFDSIFNQYLKIPNKNYNDLLSLKTLLAKYHDEGTMKSLYYNFDYQNRIIDTNKDITRLYDIHISQIRDNFLYYRGSLLSYNSYDGLSRNFFFRITKSNCDEVFFGKFSSLKIFKIEYPNFSKTFELENHFKVPISDFEKFKDSVKISVLNYEGKKFIPAELHFLN